MVFIPFKDAKDFGTEKDYWEQYSDFIKAHGEKPKTHLNWFSKVVGVPAVRYGDQVLPASVYNELQQKHKFVLGAKAPEQHIPKIAKHPHKR